jgi:translation initiation factor IF-2
MPINRPKPLFKVASEFNVSTQSIVDTLADNGMTAANRPNFKITPEMYEVLDNVYGEDKARSLEHERSKEEYESRRSHMMNQRNESVTLDNILEPLDELAPIEPAAPTSIEDDLIGGLEPLAEPEAEIEPVDESPVEPIEEETVAEELLKKRK